VSILHLKAKAKGGLNMDKRYQTALLIDLIILALLMGTPLAWAMDSNEPSVAKAAFKSTETQSNSIVYANAASAQEVWSSSITHTQADLINTEEIIIDKLSYLYQINKSVVRQLRQELGKWEEVVTALVIAQKARENADHILALRKSHQSWDQIMDSYTLIKDDVRDEVMSVMREVNNWEKSSL
jgi:hypothetical protein